MLNEQKLKLFKGTNKNKKQGDAIYYRLIKFSNIQLCVVSL